MGRCENTTNTFNPVDQARADFSHAGCDNALLDDVANARDNFNQGDYSQYMATMQGAAANDGRRLSTVTSADPDTSRAVDELRVLDFGNGELYHTLDTYYNQHGGHDRGDRGDGNIGSKDVSSFLDDLHADGPNDAKGWAKQWDEQNPNHKLEDVISDIKDDIGCDQRFDKTRLLNQLGVDNSDDIEKAYGQGHDNPRGLEPYDSNDYADTRDRPHRPNANDRPHGPCADTDAADPNREVQGTLGDLKVHGKEGSQGLYDTQYTIQSGDTLTGIARHAMGVKDNDPDPSHLQDVITAIASANHYADPNKIYAGDEMKINKDMLSTSDDRKNRSL